MEHEMATGFLHPGAMGSTVGAACAGNCLWASDRRSQESKERAEAAGLIDAITIEALVERVDMIVSVCPPADALHVAQEVADTGFDGVYIDANAVSPEQSRRIGTLFERYVDGGIIGPPAKREGSTRMYLSGPEAELASQRWANSLLDVRTIGNEIGAASALKMAYAGWTKGSRALLLSICSLAESNGVWDELQSEWAISLPDLPEQARRTATGVAPKAWRFEGEMREIATTFDSVGLPTGFHEASSDLYKMLAGLQHESEVDLARTLEEIHRTK